MNLRIIVEARFTNPHNTQENIDFKEFKMEDGNSAEIYYEDMIEKHKNDFTFLSIYIVNKII